MVTLECFHQNYQLISFTKLDIITKYTILIEGSPIHAPGEAINGLPLPYTAGKASHEGSCQVHKWNLLVLPLQKVQEFRMDTKYTVKNARK